MTYHNSTIVHNTHSRTWRDALKDLNNANEEYNKYSHIMTEYERLSIMNSFKQRRESDYSFIANGIRSEWKEAIRDYEIKNNVFEGARISEIRRWDSDKLVKEMNAVKTLVDLAVSSRSDGVFGSGKPIPETLNRIYEEAKLSGDIHKLRATCEVLIAVGNQEVSKDKAVLLRVNQLARQADKDLIDLRVTDNMVTAMQDRDQAFAALQQKNNEIAAVAETMGEGPVTGAFAGGTFVKMLKTVKFNEKDRSIEVFADDSPEVTGAYFKPVIKEGQS